MRPSQRGAAPSTPACPDRRQPVRGSRRGVLPSAPRQLDQPAPSSSFTRFITTPSTLAILTPTCHPSPPPPPAPARWTYQDATPVRPGGLAVSPSGDEVYVLVQKADAAVRRFSAAGKLLSTFGRLNAAGGALQFATFNIAADAKVGMAASRIGGSRR